MELYNYVCSLSCIAFCSTVLAILIMTFIRYMVKPMEFDYDSITLYSSCPEYKTCTYTCTSKLGDPYDDSTWTQLKLDFGENVGYYHNPLQNSYML